MILNREDIDLIWREFTFSKYNNPMVVFTKFM